MNDSIRSTRIKEIIGNCQLMIESMEGHFFALKVRRDVRIHIVRHIHVVEVKIHVDAEVVVSHRLAESRQHSWRKGRRWDLDRHIFEGISLGREGLAIEVSIASLHFDLSFPHRLFSVELYLFARIGDDFYRQFLFNVVPVGLYVTSADFTHRLRLILNENR